MSYKVEFAGMYTYKDEEDVRKAFEIITEEENKDDFEKNSLRIDNFTISEDGKTISINLKDFMSCRSWYGSHRIICKMLSNAVDGKIKCSFEGDSDEWVCAGRDGNKKGNILNLQLAGDSMIFKRFNKPRIVSEGWGFPVI